MNILVISHMYPSNKNNINGVFVQEQVEELVKIGHNVKVISPRPYVPPFFKNLSSKWDNYSRTPNRKTLNGIEIYYPKYIALPKNYNFHYSGIRMYWGIRNVIKKIRKQFSFDIIHAHVALPDGYAAMMVSKSYNVPFITTIHGQDFQHTIQKNIKCKNAVTKVLTESNKNVVVSNKLLNIGIRELQGMDYKKLSVIHNGVSQLFLEKPCSNNDISNITILSVSNLVKTKGIDLNIHSISRIINKHSNVLYKIIGDGPEKESLTKLVKELNLEKNVVFLGAKSRFDVKKHMDDSDVFLLPSWNEGFGVVYIEAMASRLPVIGCKGEGVEDIVSDGIDGYLVKPKNIDDILNKMIYLINNEDERKRIGRNAEKKVERNFTWEMIALKLDDLYQELYKK